MSNNRFKNIGGRMAAKPATAPEPDVADGPAIEKENPKRAGSQPDGRKGVLLRLSPDAWFALKSLAAEQTMERHEIFTMQSALEEAVNDLFKKYDKPPIA